MRNCGGVRRSLRRVKRKPSAPVPLGGRDYLQRAARHIASKTDVQQSYAVGKAAVEFALQGYNAVMPTIVRVSDRPYKWTIGMAKLEEVANKEKMMPRAFISADGFHITGMPYVYRAADPGRGLSAIQERVAGLLGSRAALCQKAQYRIQDFDAAYRLFTRSGNHRDMQQFRVTP